METKKQASKTKQSLCFLAYFAVCAATMLGVTKYAFYLDDLEQQPYVNKANENPSVLNQMKKRFVDTYNTVRILNPNDNVQTALYKTKELLGKEIIKSNQDTEMPFLPYRNPEGKLSQGMLLVIVYEDLATIARKMPTGNFEARMNDYAQRTERVVTLGDSNKEVLKRVRIFQGENQRN